MKVIAFLTVFATFSSVSAITEDECADQIYKILEKIESAGM